MKKTRLITTLILALACVFCMGMFAACGDTGEDDDTGDTGDTTVEITAEGTGYASWGYECNFLLQEWSDGAVDLYITHYMEGQASMLVTFGGTVTKGTDSDGDSYVQIVLTSCVATMEYEGETTEYDLGYDLDNDTYSTFTTYTLSSTGYTITITYSMFGYYDLTPSIEVSETSSPTDATSWIEQYI